jgi:hypothetical protein
MRFIIHAAAQRSPAWFAARCGRLTGSRARAILAAVPHGEALTRATYRRQLVAERFTGVAQADGFASAAMRRGVEQEPAAIAAYEAETGRAVQRTGFCAHATLQAGCSLDGAVENFAGILEVKNVNTAAHVSYKLAARFPPAYRAQVLHNLWLTGAGFCDFVSFDDRCGPAWRLFIVRVYAADLDLVGYERQVRAFLAEVDRDLQAVTALLKSGGVR